MDHMIWPPVWSRSNSNDDSTKASYGMFPLIIIMIAENDASSNDSTTIIVVQELRVIHWTNTMEDNWVDFIGKSVF